VRDGDRQGQTEEEAGETNGEASVPARTP
jgi:hypothetical protein